MKIRLMILSTVVAASALFALPANAHDPKEFDRMMSAPEAKVTPTNCAQLADIRTYTNDQADPDIKALKTRCDAENKAVTDKDAAAETNAADSEPN